MGYDVKESALKRLTYPPSLQVQDVKVADYIDAEGEKALRVVVVIADDVDLDSLDGAAVVELRSKIRSVLQDTGLFPYISFVKKHDPDA